MGNAAGVAFYEHLFDGRQDGWAEVIPWLSPFVVRQNWGLWEAAIPHAGARSGAVSA